MKRFFVTVIALISVQEGNTSKPQEIFSIYQIWCYLHNYKAQKINIWKLNMHKFIKGGFLKKKMNSNRTDRARFTVSARSGHHALRWQKRSSWAFDAKKVFTNLFSCFKFCLPQFAILGTGPSAPSVNPALRIDKMIEILYNCKGIDENKSEKWQRPRWAERKANNEDILHESVRNLIKTKLWKQTGKLKQQLQSDAKWNQESKTIKIRSWKAWKWRKVESRRSWNHAKPNHGTHGGSLGIWGTDNSRWGPNLRNTVDREAIRSVVHTYCLISYHSIPFPFIFRKWCPAVNLTFLS